MSTRRCVRLPLVQLCREYSLAKKSEPQGGGSTWRLGSNLEIFFSETAWSQSNRNLRYAHDSLAKSFGACFRKKNIGSFKKQNGLLKTISLLGREANRIYEKGGGGPWKESYP